MFKKIISSMLIVWLLGSTLSVSANTNNLMYDVPSDYSLKGHIEQMVNNGVMSVYSDGSFQPFEEVERKKAARFIYNALNKTTDLINENVDTSFAPFPDVPANDFYTKYIIEMKRLGIMNGYSNGQFGYDNKLTRWELLTILFKARKVANNNFQIPDYKNYTGLIKSSHRFGDVSLNNTFFNYIYTALDNNYISENPNFNTNNTIVKGEASKLVNNILYIALTSNDSTDNDSDINNGWDDTNTNTDNESMFYKGSMLELVWELESDNENNRLTLKVTANTNGKIPFMSKANLMLKDNWNDVVVDKITLLSKSENQYTYAIYVSDVNLLTDINLMYMDSYVSIFSSLEKEVIDNTDTDNSDTDNTDNTDNSVDNTDNTDNNIDEDDKPVATDGKVTVTAVSDFIDSSSIPNTIAVPVMALDITNGWEDAVKLDSITIEKTGLSDNDSIETVSFYDEEVKVSNDRSINSDDTATLKFNNYFEIPAGETKRVTLKVSFKDENITGGTDVKFRINSEEDIVFRTSDITLESEFPMESQKFDLVGASISTIEIQNGDTPSVINVGESAATVAAFYMVNTSSKDLKFKKITIHNKGDFNEKYFGNMKLVDSNESDKVLAEDPVFMGDEITFVLDEEVEIEQGVTMSFEILADVTDDKGSDIELYLENKDDVAVYQDFGSFKYQARVDITKFDSDTADHNTIKVEGGNVTVSEWDDNDDDIAQGDRNITLGKINITSTDEDIYVETIAFKLNGIHDWNTITDGNYNTHFSDWADKLNNLKIRDVESNLILSDTISPDEDSRIIVFSLSNLEVGPNEDKKTRKLEIIGNLSSDAMNGDEFQFEFVNTVDDNEFEVYSKFDDDLVSQDNITPSSTIKLSTKTVSNSELTIQLSSDTYTDTIIKGAEQIELISFLAKAGTKDSKIKDIKLTIEDASGDNNTSSVLDTFQNVSLYVGDNQIGNTENVVEVDQYEWTVLFDNIDYTIEQDKEVLIVVKADINSNASENDDFLVKIADEDDINAIDNNNINVKITDGDNTWSNPNNSIYENTIKDKGTVTISASSDTPDDGLFIPEDSFITVYKADIKVENETAEISKLKFNFGSSSTNDGISNVQSGKLFIGGKDTGLQWTFGSNGITFEFESNNRFEVEKNITKTIELKIKSKTGNDFKRGWTVSFELDTTSDASEFKGSQSSETLDYTLNDIAWSGSDFTYYYSIPEFEKVDENEYNEVIPSADQVLLVAKVRNSGVARILLESVAVKKTGNATVTNVRAYVSDSGMSISEQNRVTSTSDYLAFNIGSETKGLKLTKNSTAGETFDNGEWKYITIVGDLNNSFKGNAISLSLEPSTDAGKLVWHDDEASNTNNVNDNLYVENLPLTKSWINTQDPVTAGADTTAPTVVSANYYDANGNWTIDRVTVTLGESIEGDNATDFRIQLGANTFRSTQMSIAGVQAILTGFQTWNGSAWEDVNTGSEKYLANSTGWAYELYYQNSGNGNPIKDLAWNFLVNIDSGAALSITDSASPVLLSASLTDGGSDGIFTLDDWTDSLSLVFSETVDTVQFGDFRNSIDIEEPTGGNDFNAVVSDILNADLYTALTDNLSQSTTTVSNDTVTVNSDWTNTASTTLLTTGNSQVRIKSGQTSIQDAAGNNALSGNAVTIN